MLASMVRPRISIRSTGLSGFPATRNTWTWLSVVRSAFVPLAAPSASLIVAPLPLSFTLLEPMTTVPLTR